MRTPWWLFVLATVCVGGVVILTGKGETSPLVWAGAAAGSLVSLAGGAYGRPQLVFAGAASLLGIFGFTLSSGSSDAVVTLAAAVLLWLHVELVMRSMELRRAVAPSTPAAASWIATVVAVVGGTVVLWLVIGAVEAGAPPGGLMYRLLAVGGVVIVALLASGILVRRGETGPRLPG